jgi:hypothetical protein
MMKKIQLVKHRMEYCEEIFKLSSAPPVKDVLGLADGCNSRRYKTICYEGYARRTDGYHAAFSTFPSTNELEYIGYNDEYHLLR